MYNGKSSFRAAAATICVLAAMMCFFIARASGQDKKDWRSGTLIQVKAQEPASGDNASEKRYEVTVQVGQKIYVASHTSKDGEPDLEYYVGMARMVLIDGDTLTFSDLLGHSHSMRIISSKDAPATPEK